MQLLRCRTHGAAQSCDGADALLILFQQSMLYKNVILVLKMA